MVIIRLVLPLKYTGILKLLSSLSSGECRCCLTATPLLCLLTVSVTVATHSLTRSLYFAVATHACNHHHSHHNHRIISFEHIWLPVKMSQTQILKSFMNTLLHICLWNALNKSRARMSKFGNWIWRIATNTRYREKNTHQIGIFVRVSIFFYFAASLHSALSSLMTSNKPWNKQMNSSLPIENIDSNFSSKSRFHPRMIQFFFQQQCMNNFSLHIWFKFYFLLINSSKKNLQQKISFLIN